MLIILPSRLTFGKRKPKTLSLTMNWYRNAPFHQAALAKIMFAEIVAPRIKHLPNMSKIRISYHLYVHTNQLCDVANFCSIVDKFFCDVLTTEQKIPDDNYTHVLSVAFGFGGVDKSNPRIEAFIEML